MVTYKCTNCCKIYENKAFYTRHINRKFPCKKQEDTSTQNTTSVPHFDTSTNNIDTEFTCEFCNKKYSRKDVLSRHLKNNCKVKKHQDKEKRELFDKLKNEIDKQNEEMNKLKDKMNENNQLKNEIDKRNKEINILKNKLNENEQLKKNNDELQTIVNNALLNDKQMIYSVKHPKPKKPHLVCTTDIVSSSIQPFTKQPTIFTFNGETFIYVVDKKGIIWFNGKEVVSLLGYTNPRKAIHDHINEKYVTTFDEINRGNDSLPLDHNEKTSLYISEFGLYQLLATSKLDNDIIKSFQDVLYEEILPSIRKNGKYEIPNLFSNIKSFYNDHMITSYIGKNVVYIGITSHVVMNNGIMEVLAKFGKTGRMTMRDIDEHRKFFDDFKVVFIRECDNYEEIEKLFKIELKALELYRQVEIKGVNCIELFTVKEDYTMDNVINLMNRLIENNPLKSIENKNNKIKELENGLELEKLKARKEITKQKELDNEKLKMEFEIKKLELKLKLKN